MELILFKKPKNKSVLSKPTWPQLKLGRKVMLIDIENLLSSKLETVYLKVSPMKSVQRFGVKRKLAPRYVGPFEIIGQSGKVAYKIQLPPEMSAIFNVFHVSQLKKYLRVPEERVPLGDIELKSDLTFEEKPVRVIDTRERVTRSRVVKFYKVMWSNQGSERDATWEREDYLRDGYKEFYQQWYVFQISGRDFYKGGGL